MTAPRWMIAGKPPPERRGGDDVGQIGISVPAMRGISAPR